MKYIFIPVVGPILFYSLPDNKVPSFEKFKDIISAQSLEVVHCHTNYRHLMLIDECGKICDPPKEVNFRASALYGGFPNDLIVGDVILGKEGYTPEGVDIVGFNDDEVKEYVRFFCE